MISYLYFNLVTSSLFFNLNMIFRQITSLYFFRLYGTYILFYIIPIIACMISTYLPKTSDLIFLHVKNELKRHCFHFVRIVAVFVLNFSVGILNCVATFQKRFTLMFFVRRSRTDSM